MQFLFKTVDLFKLFKFKIFGLHTKLMSKFHQLLTKIKIYQIYQILALMQQAGQHSNFQGLYKQVILNKIFKFNVEKDIVLHGSETQNHPKSAKNTTDLAAGILPSTTTVAS